VAEKAAKSEIDKQVGSIKGKASKSKKDSVAAAQSKVDKARVVFPENGMSWKKPLTSV